MPEVSAAEPQLFITDKQKLEQFQDLPLGIYFLQYWVCYLMGSRLVSLSGAKSEDFVFKAAEDPLSWHEMSSFSKLGRKASDFWHNLQWPLEALSIEGTWSPSVTMQKLNHKQKSSKANQKYLGFQDPFTSCWPVTTHSCGLFTSA